VPSLSRTGGRTCTHPGVDEECPREPARRHWKMTMGKISTFTLPSCAASFKCSLFKCRPPLPLGLQHQQQASNGPRWPLAVTSHHPGKHAAAHADPQGQGKPCSTRGAA